MSYRARILIVDDEPLMRVPLADRLEMAGYEVTAVATGEEALAAVATALFDVAIIDLRLPGMDGLEVIRRMRAMNCQADSVVMTAHGTIQTAVEAMKLGARDFLTKPFATEQLLDMVQRYVRVRTATVPESASGPRTTDSYFGMIGQSPAMLEVFRLIEAVADTDATIIIRGETGTGKELVAGALQQRSSRRDKPFVKVNCAAIPETLFEAELFGFERGAFTGADRKKKGRFELAADGTLLLDEMDEMPLVPQAKVLRAIQEHELERLGGIETVKLKMRLLATTKVDLRERVAQGRFREDLFYRLNVLPITLPPLRERGDDVLLLGEHFLLQAAQETRRPARRLSLHARALLRNHSWPGNVRELRNALSRAVMLCADEIVEPVHLGIEPVQPPSPPPPSLAEAVGEAESRRIQEALTATGGHKGKAAELLGISRKTLWEKLNRKTR